MQLLLSFAQEPLDPPESHPNIWQTLNAPQQGETLTILARLLAKAVVEQRKTKTAVKGKRDSHE
jgi:hypothetical protein